MTTKKRTAPAHRRKPVKTDKGGLYLAIKGALVAGVATVLVMLLAAVLMKFGIVGESIIPAFNQVLKAVGIVFAAWIALRTPAERPWFRALLAGLFYILLSEAVFMLIAGTFGLALTMLYDILAGVAIGALSGLIFGKKIERKE